MKNSKAKRVMAILGTLAGVVVGVWVLTPTLLRPRQSELEPLPNPNAYDTLLSASDEINGDATAALVSNVDTLRAFLSSNTAALDQIHRATTQDFCLPTAKLLTNSSWLSTDTIALKKIAWMIKAEGDLALKEGRTNDALQTFCEGMRYGNRIARGGFLIHRLVGIACERIAMEPLLLLAPELDQGQRLTIIRMLEQAESDSIQWNEIVRNERLFMRSQVRNLSNPAEWFRDWRTARNAIIESEGKHKVAAAWQRLLLTELALHSFLDDNGEAPQDLEQLVPVYLKRIPRDPFSNEPLVYRPNSTNWLLYSIGSDGRDDGGKHASNAMPGFLILPSASRTRSETTSGDLFLDTPW